jgi:hypothetical protein
MLKRNKIEMPGMLSRLRLQTLKTIFLFTLLCICSFAAKAQIYPVSAITQITTPYPISLDEFVNGEASKVRLTLNINDATLDAYPVKLRMKLASGSVTLTTSASFNTDPIYLTAGENPTLDATDLAAYFSVGNLDFSGYSKSQYSQTGYLPEGVYQLSFEVLHFTRGYVISSSIPAYIYIYVNSPPLLNLPANKLQMDVGGTQNILFNWSFMHSAYSYPGFSPEYIFEMWEIYPATLDANAVAVSSEPIFTQTLQSTSLTYTNAEPLLVTGRKYCWRVRVTDPQETAVFKNKGYSEVYWFTYGIDCQPPVLALADSGTGHVSVQWETPQSMSGFYLRYVPARDSSGEWYGTSTSYLEAKVSNLDSDTKYYLEVKGKCGVQESDYSNRVAVTTKKDMSYQCGGSSSVVAPDNTNLLTGLNKGDIIKAGDFEVEVATVSGNTTFTGKGYVLVPYFNFIKLIATFDNIQVNTRYQLVSGSITTMYDINNSLSLNLGDMLSDSSSDDDTEKEENPFTDVCTSKLKVDDNIVSISVSGGTITVNGNKEGTISTGYTSVTSSGAAFVVDSTGTVYKQSTDGEAPRSSSLSIGTPAVSDSAQGIYSVTFTKHPGQHGGFDTPGSTTPEGNYNTATANGKSYLASWKSVETGKIDKLMATITGTPADSVFFSRESAQTVMKSNAENDNQRQLLVTGDGDQTDDQLYAWYRQITSTSKIDTAKKDTTITHSAQYYKAGAVNLASYEKIHVNLCLVSVNQADVPNAAYIQEELNKIYAPAIVDFTVTTLDGGLTVELSTSGQLNNTDADDNMNFTDEEKLVVKALKKNEAYDSDNYYLFFLNSGKKSSMKGYMPFKSHFGFIFKNGQNPDELIRTIAHEPGHGVFRLRHTFSPENKYVQNEGDTDNLMDYVNSAKALTARRLYKYQWDYVHNPETMWFTAWEDEGEGEENGLAGKIWTHNSLSGQGWKNVEKVAINTTSYRQFYNNVKSQNKFDVLFCSFSGVANGYTFKFKDHNDYMKQKYPVDKYGKVGVIVKLKSLEDKSMETFFKNGKQLIVITINENQLNNSNAKDLSNSAATVVHEAIAHGELILKGEDNITILQQHQKYYNSDLEGFGEWSPTDDDVRTDPRYKDSQAKKDIDETDKNAKNEM